MLPYGQKTSNICMLGFFFFSYLVLSGQLTEPSAMKPYNLHFVTSHIIEQLQSRLRAAVWTVVSGFFSKFFSECREREPREWNLRAPGPGICRPSSRSNEGEEAGPWKAQ